MMTLKLLVNLMLTSSVSVFVFLVVGIIVDGQDCGMSDNPPGYFWIFWFEDCRVSGVSNYCSQFSRFTNIKCCAKCSFPLLYLHYDVSRGHAATEQVGTLVMHLICIQEIPGLNLGS